MFPDRGHLPSQGCVAWLDENRGDKEPSLCSSYTRSEAHPLPGPHPVLRRALSHGQKADCRLPDKSDDSVQATLPSVQTVTLTGAPRLSHVVTQTASVNTKDVIGMVQA